MGGGRAKFLPVSSKDDEGNVGERSDGQDLIKEWLLDKTNRTKKAKFITTRQQLLELDPNKGTDYLLGMNLFFFLSWASHSPSGSTCQVYVIVSSWPYSSPGPG
jgi:Alkaline phosphatase